MPAAQRFDVVALGDLVVDFVVEIDHFPVEAGRHQLTSGHVLEPGGACNFLIAAARLGLHAAALSLVGEDLYADFLLDALAQEGVDVAGVERSGDKQTVVVVTLVAGGQHTFLGGMVPTPVTEIPSTWREAIAASRALFVEGYAFTELSPGMVMDAIRTARAAGAPVFFDLGPELAAVDAGLLAETLETAQVLLLTEEEAAAVTGAADASTAARRLRRRPDQWVVIKRGADGCLVDAQGSQVHVPGFPVTVRDTSGAGDSFDAGMVYGFLHGMTPEACARLANAVGAVTVSKLGAGRNVATRTEVEGMLKIED
ncbi:MAG: hypothetical protein D6790_11670 [Caldilineae bacterium]|nr:MAG: hypothetical protein D6790_11670 [Caldilineae bacterium]